jgi:hypothetical protein
MIAAAYTAFGSNAAAGLKISQKDVTPDAPLNVAFIMRASPKDSSVLELSLLSACQSNIVLGFGDHMLTEMDFSKAKGCMNEAVDMLKFELMNDEAIDVKSGAVDYNGFSAQSGMDLTALIVYGRVADEVQARPGVPFRLSGNLRAVAAYVMRHHELVSSRLRSHTVTTASKFGGKNFAAIAWAAITALWPNGAPETSVAPEKLKSVVDAVERALDLMCDGIPFFADTEADLPACHANQIATSYDAFIDLGDKIDTFSEFEEALGYIDDVSPAEAERMRRVKDKVLLILGRVLEAILADKGYFADASSTIVHSGSSKESIEEAEQCYLWFSSALSIFQHVFSHPSLGEAIQRTNLFLVVAEVVQKHSDLGTGNHDITKLRDWSRLFCQQEAIKVAQTNPGNRNSPLIVALTAFNAQNIANTVNVSIDALLNDILGDTSSARVTPEFMVVLEELKHELPAAGWLESMRARQRLQQTIDKGERGSEIGVLELTSVLLACEGCPNIMRQQRRFEEDEKKAKKMWETKVVELSNRLLVGPVDKFLEDHKDLDAAILSWEFKGNFAWSHKGEQDHPSVKVLVAMETFVVGAMPAVNTLVQLHAKASNRFPWLSEDLRSTLSDHGSGQELIQEKVTAVGVAIAQISATQLVVAGGSKELQAKRLATTQAYWKDKLGVGIGCLPETLKDMLLAMPAPNAAAPSGAASSASSAPAGATTESSSAPPVPAKKKLKRAQRE